MHILVDSIRSVTTRRANNQQPGRGSKRAGGEEEMVGGMMAVEQGPRAAWLVRGSYCRSYDGQQADTTHAAPLCSC